MSMILIVFDLSFVFRGTYNELYARLEWDGFEGNVSNILTTSVFDLIPVSLILYYHMTNFKTIKIASVSNKQEDDPINDAASYAPECIDVTYALATESNWHEEEGEGDEYNFLATSMMP